MITTQRQPRSIVCNTSIGLRLGVKAPDANRFAMKRGERVRSHIFEYQTKLFRSSISLIFILTICRPGLTVITTDAASADRESVDNRRFSRRQSNELVSLGFITGTTNKMRLVSTRRSDFSRNHGRSSTNRRLTIFIIYLYFYDCFPCSSFFAADKCNA